MADDQMDDSYQVPEYTDADEQGHYAKPNPELDVPSYESPMPPQRDRYPRDNRRFDRGRSNDYRPQNSQNYQNNQNQPNNYYNQNEQNLNQSPNPQQAQDSQAEGFRPSEGPRFSDNGRPNENYQPRPNDNGQLPYQVNRKFNNLNNPTHDSNDSMRRNKRRNQMNRIKNKFFKKRPYDNAPFDPNNPQQQGQQPLYQQGPPTPVEIPTEIFEGVVHLMDRYQGYMRFAKQSFFPRPTDPWISKDFIEQYGLRTGLTITGKVGMRKDRRVLMELLTIEGEPPVDWHMVPYFHSLTSVNPYEFFHLSTPSDVDKSMTLLELFTPIGMGQRALIVAPPRAGKTILMEKIVNGITANHPDVEAMVLLVDERPEEVTHLQRRVNAKVYASCLDKPISEHVAVSRMVIEMAQRKAERGKNVVLLLDSITRMARAFNNQLKSTGRTLSGGVDAQALTEPKKFFGAARKNEEGGSLTIIATALVQTGSQMDEVIFQEFKGTGNMELVLSRKLAEKRIYPALDINQSGTRREELILPADYYKASIKFRRYLSTLGETNQVPAALQAVEKYKTTQAFVREFV